MSDEFARHKDSAVGSEIYMVNPTSGMPVKGFVKEIDVAARTITLWVGKREPKVFTFPEPVKEDASIEHIFPTPMSAVSSPNAQKPLTPDSVAEAVDSPAFPLTVKSYNELEHTNDQKGAKP